MRTTKTITSGIIITFVVLSSLLAGLIINKLHSTTDEIKSRTGQRIILQKDTLMVIDYSLLNTSYVLEDGRQISFSLADKLEWVVDGEKDCNK